jgi:excisionase family DNA binding protein
LIAARNGRDLIQHGTLQRPELTLLEDEATACGRKTISALSPDIASRAYLKGGPTTMADTTPAIRFEEPITVKTAAQFLGVSPSLVYAYVERKQIPHFRMMGRSIRFRLSELAEWRKQFHVNGGIE